MANWLEHGCFVPTFLYELATGLWLLIKGLPQTDRPVSAGYGVRLESASVVRGEPRGAYYRDRDRIPIVDDIVAQRIEHLIDAEPYWVKPLWLPFSRLVVGTSLGLNADPFPPVAPAIDAHLERETKRQAEWRPLLLQWSSGLSEPVVETAVMRLHLLAVASVCFSLWTVPSSVPVVAASSAIALPDCSGKPVVKPSSVILACADAGVVADHVTWTGWGGAVAGGAGVASVNDCEPNCAAGHLHNYKVMLHAAGRQRCPSGQAAYARVSYAWIGQSPYGPGTTTLRYPCARR